MSYCLIRFPQYAGKAAGLVGGGFSVVTSILSSLLVNFLSITNQTVLGIGYGVLVVGVLFTIIRTKWIVNERPAIKENAERSPATAAA
jgi:hypothetical protein